MSCRLSNNSAAQQPALSEVGWGGMLPHTAHATLTINWSKIELVLKVLGLKPMHVPPPHPLEPHTARTRISRSIAALAATVLAPLLASCASPGPPRPPSLHLPAIVTNLTAERVGDQIKLNWTTPTHTTDNLPVPEPLTAEICREPNPAPPSAAATAAGSAACAVVLHLAVKPGPSEATDRLPPALAADPVLPLAYRVRLLNPEGRSAGPSKAAIAPSGSAPPPVAGLHVAATRAGAVIEWQPLGSPAIVELRRSLVVTGQPNPAKKSDMFAGSEPTDVQLRTADPKATPSAPDPGGTLDRGVQRGESYTYRAQRLRTVSAGGQTFELRSELSPPFTFSLNDTFPPATPTGLASVPSASNGKAAIDLSWEPATDTDLAGYNVYRRTGSGSFEKLTATPLPGPAFSDSTVTPGSSYTYRVTSVDATGNESPHSAEVTETAHAPTP